MMLGKGWGGIRVGRNSNNVIMCFYIHMCTFDICLIAGMVDCRNTRSKDGNMKVFYE